MLQQFLIKGYKIILLNLEEQCTKALALLWPFSQNFNQNVYLPVLADTGHELVDNPFQQSILWAVPKSRRTIEKRRSRRVGSTNYFCKLIPVKKLLMCQECGNSHEVGRLCPFCFEKVMKVTDAIKNAMKFDSGKKPIENEYVASFSGEKIDSQDGFYEGKRIIEVEMERPSWFPSNLKQKSNVTPSTQSSPTNPNPLHIKL